MKLQTENDQVRILYFFCYRNFIILTHVFTKSTNRVPESEIKRAQKLRTDFLQRFSENQLKEAQNEDI